MRQVNWSKNYSPRLPIYSLREGPDVIFNTHYLKLCFPLCTKSLPACPLLSKLAGRGDDSVST